VDAKLGLKFVEGRFLGKNSNEKLTEESGRKKQYK
jgi:hypothetical protein